MILFILIIYIISSLLIIKKNYRNPGLLWLVFMFMGYSIACLGLTFYSEYVYSAHNIKNSLFHKLGDYILFLNYYLNLDIFDMYRLMNIGTALYVYGAVCFPLLLVRRKDKKKVLFYSLIPLLYILALDPDFLHLIYQNSSSFFQILLVKYHSIFNFIARWVLKLLIILSIIASVVMVKKVLLISKKKYELIIISILPIHILFIFLFYWYPNQNIFYTRAFQLSVVHVPYNNVLFNIIIVLAIISAIILTYVALKFNLIEMSRSRKKIDFDLQFNTAQSGLKVFSHSLKNQFIAIKLLAETMELHGDNKMDEINKIRTICSKSIKRLNNLPIQLSKIRLSYSAYDVVKVLEEIIHDYTNIEVTSTPDDCFIWIDKEYFFKVIRNILTNSIEASKDNEDVIISIDIKNEYEFCIISIGDNGKGLKKSELKQLFEPFYTTKPTATNWGLGLSFCQSVIVAFGGEIILESIYNKGTTVTIYLPVSSRPKKDNCVS